LSGYHATVRTPVLGEAFGYTFAGVPPPSSGGAAIFGALRFLSGYETPLASDTATLSVHRMAEAMRHAFAIRMSLCDPDFFSNITTSAVHDLVAGPYMENLRKITLDNDTLPLSMYGGASWAQLHDTDGQKEAKDAHEGDRRLRQNRRLARPFGYLEDSGTSHLSVVDKDGNAVAMTTSVNLIFGSAVFSEKTGILLGDTMDGTSLHSFVSKFV
jgi:gamma-glutamyltranspeptidase